jgi:rare lipoprotein A
MNTRHTRRIGILFAFFVLGGCAMPPGGPATQADNALRTKGAQGTSVANAAPQGYDTDVAKVADDSKSKTSLADAEPLTDHDSAVADFHQTGRASWYGRLFHGRKTANGERFNMNALTAAHRTLPLGSYVRVTDPSTSRSVVVRINDRGPYVRGRVIDLSYAAARMLHLAHSGTANVKIEGLTPREAKQEMNEMLASNNASADSSK